MSIYSETIPYFYIIRNKESGIMYAGSKWAEGSNPHTFMVEAGYQTSSPTIRNIIKEFGLDVFEILRIDTYCDGIHVYDYETIFLETNDCAGSGDWYNKHNNSRPPPFGSKEFKVLLFEKYGIEVYKNINKKTNITCVKKYGNLEEFWFQTKQFKLSSKTTKLEKYGDENYFNVEKAKNTKIERYGDENYNNKEKRKETCLIRYGVESPQQSPEIKKKSDDTKIKKYGSLNYYNTEQQKNTCMERYGVDNPMKLDEVKDKVKQTWIENYGIDHPMKHNGIKEKSKQTSLERYGVDSPTKSPEIKEKIKQTFLEKYGVDSPTKIKKICDFCGEYKTLIHEAKCPKRGNNKKTTYILKSPAKEIFKLYGQKEVIAFCKSNGVGWQILKKKKIYKDWEFIDIIK